MDPPSPDINGTFVLNIGKLSEKESLGHKILDFIERMFYSEITNAEILRCAYYAYTGTRSISVVSSGSERKDDEKCY